MTRSPKTVVRRLGGPLTTDDSTDRGQEGHRSRQVQGLEVLGRQKGEKG